MAFWWVNHKQTFKQEFEGGYIWSPKRKKNGARSQTYENLCLVQPADVVFSYADGQIKAIGRAISGCEDAAKPGEFGAAGNAWDKDGWRVRIEWERLLKPIRPKAHLPTIAPLLPSKHSPIRAVNGDGIQSCYLASISNKLGLFLVGLAGSSVDEEEIIEAEEKQQEALLWDLNIAETEKEQLVKSRRGQGTFRTRLEDVEKACRLTGITDGRFLIASHIKPWRFCSNKERLDGYNGFLLAPHVDLLFDKGYISFSDDGVILSGALGRAMLKAWGIDPEGSIGGLREEQKKYLAYHRDEIFTRKQTRS